MSRQATEYAVLFDGSFDGLLCVVYAFYYDRILPRTLQCEDAYQPMLDTETYYVATDTERAFRVMEGIRNKATQTAAWQLYTASLSGENDIYMDLFKYAVLCFKYGPEIDRHLQNDAVLRIHKLSRMTASETHLLTGFCRFAETKAGVYYCAITPKHHVLPLLAEHFRDRFMNQPWIIHDKKRNLAAIYDGHAYVIERVPTQAHVAYVDEEEEVQRLWKAFYQTIGIKERTNKKGQRQHLPLYFRGNMTEFLP